MNKLGLYFGKEKLEALFRGDISNAVVDRCFVHALQAAGMHLCGTLELTPATVLLQARYSQAAAESHIQINRTNNHELKVQALVLLVHIFIVVGFPTSAQLYLSKACKIIEKAKLRLLPVYGRPAGFSEQVREDAAVLSQAIFLDNYFYLTLSGSTSGMTARIEGEFRLDLQVRIGFVVPFEVGSAAWSSEPTQSYSIYAH